MLAFYPVDVWKTSLQADATGKKCCDDDDDGNDVMASKSIRNRRLGGTTASSLSTSKSSSASASSTRTTTMKSLTRLLLFRGLPFKIAHTLASSFTYFYVYSLLQTKYAAYHLQQSSRIRQANTSSSSSPSFNTTSKSNTNSSSSSAVTKLVLTAVAAMINTGITLPLDTIASWRQVAALKSGYNDGKHDDGVANDDEEDATPPNDVKNSKRRQQQQTNQPRRQLQQNRQQLTTILSLWNGLLPALLLCTNPAIQYTLYDTLKAAWLAQHPGIKQRH